MRRDAACPEAIPVAVPIPRVDGRATFFGLEDLFPNAIYYGI
jgi:hypothetical protein